MEIRQIEFSKLRHAYVTVKTFIDKETDGYNKSESLKSNLKGDIGLYGDDNLDLLEKFVNKFELDFKNFDYDKHFHSEEELFGTEAALYNLLSLSVWLPLKTIELLTFNKVKLVKPKLPVTPGRIVADLSFKDMLIWYIEKEYKTSGEIKYEIKL